LHKNWALEEKLSNYLVNASNKLWTANFEKISSQVNLFVTTVENRMKVEKEFSMWAMAVS